MSNTLTKEDVIDAYRLFLGRAPADPESQTSQSFDQLISSLFWSAEFQKSPRSKKNGLGWPEAQYFVARHKKVMYCPIGKVACSFLKSTLVEVAEHPHKEVLKRRVHMLTDHVKTGLQLSDYGEADVAEMMSDPEMLRFAVIREPGRRLLSGYIEKFVHNRLESGNVKYHTSGVVAPVQANQGLEKTDFDRGISFRDFVEFIVAQPPETLDPHWRAQSLYLAGAEWQLYMQEGIEALISDLSHRTGVKLENMQLNRTNSGKGQQVAGADRMLPAEIEAIGSIDAGSFIAPDLDEKIRKFYADDYALIASIR